MLIGLAVGVDYSLFYIRRAREARRAGLGPHAALEAAAATVGRAIVVSGLTVMVAIGGLLITGLQQFASMAVGTIIVVAIAVLGSLTVLPAALALLGDRIDRGRLPGLGTPRVRRGVWGAVAGAATRHPRRLAGHRRVRDGRARGAGRDDEDRRLRRASRSRGDAGREGAARDRAGVPRLAGACRAGGHRHPARADLEAISKRALAITGGRGAGRRSSAAAAPRKLSVPMPDRGLDDADATVDRAARPSSRRRVRW